MSNQVTYISDEHKILHESISEYCDTYSSLQPEFESIKSACGSASSVKQLIDIKENFTTAKTICDVAVMKITRKEENLFTPEINSTTLDGLDPMPMLNSLLEAVQGTDSVVEKRLDQFISAAASADPGKALTSIALDELKNSGWSLNVEITPDGKTATLINGNDVIDFLKAGINGDTLSGQQILMGVITKFEKEALGFSVVELAKDVDKFASALKDGSGAGLLDALQGSLLDKVETIVGKLGGNTEYIKKIKSIAKLAKNLVDGYQKMIAARDKALKDFEKLKEKLIVNGEILPLEVIEATEGEFDPEIPPEEVTEPTEGEFDPEIPPEEVTEATEGKFDPDRKTKQHLPKKYNDQKQTEPAEPGKVQKEIREQFEYFDEETYGDEDF